MRVSSDNRMTQSKGRLSIRPCRRHLSVSNTALRLGLVLLMCAALARVGNAQNIKFATIRWRQEAVVPPTVRFQLTTAWKWSSYYDALSGCQAQCKNVAGGLQCQSNVCTGISPTGGMAPGVGDIVAFYDVFSTTAGVSSNTGAAISLPPLLYEQNVGVRRPYS